MAVRFRQQGVAQGHGVVVQETRLAQRMHAGAGGVHHQGGQAEAALDRAALDVEVLPKGLDVARAYTLEFVNKGIGKPT